LDALINQRQSVVSQMLLAEGTRQERFSTVHFCQSLKRLSVLSHLVKTNPLQQNCFVSLITLGQEQRLIKIACLNFVLRLPELINIHDLRSVSLGAGFGHTAKLCLLPVILADRDRHNVFARFIHRPVQFGEFASNQVALSLRGVRTWRLARRLSR
jgi:hypothetical protein